MVRLSRAEIFDPSKVVAVHSPSVVRPPTQIVPASSSRIPEGSFVSDFDKDHVVFVN